MRQNNYNYFFGRWVVCGSCCTQRILGDASDLLIHNHAKKKSSLGRENLVVINHPNKFWMINGDFLIFYFFLLLLFFFCFSSPLIWKGIISFPRQQMIIPNLFTIVQSNSIEVASRPWVDQLIHYKYLKFLHQTKLWSWQTKDFTLFNWVTISD